MLCKIKSLKGYKLHANDGDLGKVKDFYFDDQHWAIRYLVAETGSWMTDRQVLISPYALVKVTKEKQQIAVNLTKKQIEGSPPLASDKPVSRQFEEAYFGYYGFPMYWGGPYMWGYHPDIVRDPELWKKITQGGKTWDPHLRSAHDVSGHHVQASDGEIGHVDDFIFDDETWAIRYLVINTSNWWVGKKILISPRWAERVSWDEAKVFVSLSREAIRQSPEYAEELLLARNYEDRLHRHYRRQGYWVDERISPPAATAKSANAPLAGSPATARAPLAPHTASVEGSVKPPRNSTSTDGHHTAISHLAYAIAQADGFRPGKELDYWLTAEAQVNATARVAMAGNT